LQLLVYFYPIVCSFVYSINWANKIKKRYSSPKLITYWVVDFKIIIT
jgi:hypothetical protein